MNRHSFRTIAVVLGVGASLALAACGDDTDEAADTTAAAAATTAADTAGSSTEAGVTVEGAWARTSPMMATAGAAYMTLTSATDDALVGASVDASIAGTVEIHETKMADMGGMSGTTMEGSTETTAAPAMEMVPVDRVELPAGEAVALAPGGLHIMLLDLVAPLEVGSSFPMTLTFASGATQVVDVPVLDAAP